MAEQRTRVSEYARNIIPTPPIYGEVRHFEDDLRMLVRKHERAYRSILFTDASSVPLCDADNPNATVFVQDVAGRAKRLIEEAAALTFPLQALREGVR